MVDILDWYENQLVPEDTLMTDLNVRNFSPTLPVIFFLVLIDL